ncbi:MAG: DUF1684 domain-containing protein [Chitinophagaceae bacterium]
MLRIGLMLALCISFFQLRAQSYSDVLTLHREKYKEEFRKDPKSPLEKKELKYLRFYPADSTWKLKARFERLVDTVGFMMQTHSGVEKKYFFFGRLAFMHEGLQRILFVYHSEKLANTPGYEDYLFLPFTDATNYTETFGGGRYIDLRTGDIRNGEIELDFNKAYNPYCAYKGGYNCPIPPAENKMPFPIRAGEKLFGKPVKE